VFPSHRRWPRIVEVNHIDWDCHGEGIEAALIASEKEQADRPWRLVHGAQATNLLNLNRDSQTESSKARRGFGYAQH
jgi:hypothetical protein